MARKGPVRTSKTNRNSGSAHATVAPIGVDDTIMENAPDPILVWDLEGKILQANDAVSQLLGFRRDAVVEQPLTRFIGRKQTRGLRAALRAVVEDGVTRDVRLDAHAASGEMIPTSLSASALRDQGGKVIGAIGALHDMRGYEEALHDLEQLNTELEKELEGAKQEVGKLKSELMATVSHELRTPLAAINGSAQTLLRRDLELDATSRARLLAVIASESERLTRIATDILLADSIGSGRLQLDRSPLDLVELASEVVEQMQNVVAAREDVVIELDAGDETAFVACDADKLRQVLINLVDNAVKYSPDGGHVKVRVESHEHRLRLLVLDEGLGIARGEQQRIFGKFYRVDPQQPRGVGGTGLGLYISHELVRLMGGRLSVTSKEHEGSTFVVELPVGPAQEKEAAGGTRGLEGLASPGRTGST